MTHWKEGANGVMFLQLDCCIHAHKGYRAQFKLGFRRKRNQVTGSEDVGKVSTAVSSTAEAGSSPSEMQVSKPIVFVSYRLSTMPSVVCHDIFPWSPVSSYKSQQCCQNSRAASAESICKVSSWALASSGASQSPVILCCLWHLSATQTFLQLS